MSKADYIPAGRTSLIPRGSAKLQLQTEYACRPNPRLTTSISTKGRVVHKIEQELTRSVNSFEEKAKVEDLLRKQHMQVIKMIQDKKASLVFLDQQLTDESEKTLTPLSRISNIDGVEKVYCLDNDGNFNSDTGSVRFRKRYSVVLNSLLEIISLFDLLPGGERQKGVCEIEHNRLYFASGGRENYFVITRSGNNKINYETEINSAIHR